MSNQINPEVVLKAAQMAIPNTEFTIVDGRARVVNWFGNVGTRNFKPYWFNPLQSAEDAWALERALKKEGWSFPCFVHGIGFSALHQSYKSYRESGFYADESDTLLLLKCVAAQHNLDLYTGDKA